MARRRCRLQLAVALFSHVSHALAYMQSMTPNLPPKLHLAARRDHPPAPVAVLLPTAVAANPWTAFAVLGSASAAGRELGRTPWGNALSGPVCTMAVTFFASVFGILPPAPSVVGLAQINAIRLATPLLLLSANLRAVSQSARMLLPSFALGTLGTIAGVMCGLAGLREPLVASFGPEGLKAACSLAAKVTGAR